MIKTFARKVGQILAATLSTSYLSNPAEWFKTWITGGGTNAAGVAVNRKTALTLAACYEAQDIISSDVAKLPIHVMKRLEEGGKERYREHPAYYLMRRKPCAELTAFHFIRTLTHHALSLGNGYAYIYRDAAYRPTEIVPLDPEQTFPTRVDGRLWYVTHVNGEPHKLQPANVMHIRGMGFDGLAGYSIISLASESIGLSLAAQKFGATFFGSGSVASGIIEYPGKMNPKAREDNRAMWNDVHEGLKKSHKIAIFDQGMKFTPLTIPPEQAQFLATREFQVREIARWYKMPPHKLGEKNAASRSTLEAENRSYIEGTLDPWLIAWESEIWDKLLTEEEKRSDDVVVESHRLSLLKGDSRTRYANYHQGLLDGWMNRDEVRAAENMNPLPDGEGQAYFVPLNMATTGGADDDTTAEDREDAADQAAAAKAAGRALIVDTAGRLVRWEISAIDRLKKKGPADLVDQVAEFYADHQARITAALMPVIGALMPNEPEDAADLVEFAASAYGRQAHEAALAWIDDGPPVATPAEAAEKLADYFSEI